MSRSSVAFLALLGASCVTPLSKGYEIHTSDLACDEANRLVYAALGDMRMEVTAFTPAKPGQTGSLRAVRRADGGSKLSGSVEVRCEGGRVHVVANQDSDLLGDKEFERGVFLGVTGRGNLEVVREGRLATGEVRRRDTGPLRQLTQTSEAAESPTLETTPVARAAEPVLTVRVEALRGFASVLDFDADLSARGVLPVQVSIRNGTKRAYDFDPGSIVVTAGAQRSPVRPFSLAEAQRRVESSPADAVDTSAGDLATARRLMAEKALAGGRIGPGAERAGFVYFPLGGYDRARMSMVDVATGESEGFVVDF
jgi:hypothetical protein